MRITFYITHKHSKYFEYRILAVIPNSEFNTEFVYAELIHLLYELRVPESDHPIEIINMATYESEAWKVQVIFL